MPRAHCRPRACCPAKSPVEALPAQISARTASLVAAFPAAAANQVAAQSFPGRSPAAATRAVASPEIASEPAQRSGTAQRPVPSPGWGMPTPVTPRAPRWSRSRTLPRYRASPPSAPLASDAPRSSQQDRTDGGRQLTAQQSIASVTDQQVGTGDVEPDKTAAAQAGPQELNRHREDRRDTCNQIDRGPLGPLRRNHPGRCLRPPDSRLSGPTRTCRSRILNGRNPGGCGFAIRNSPEPDSISESIPAQPISPAPTSGHTRAVRHTALTRYSTRGRPEHALCAQRSSTADRPLHRGDRVRRRAHLRPTR